MKAPLFVLCLLLTADRLPARQPAPPYHLPPQFSFDYEVVQRSVNKKNKSDTAEMHYFFTKSGDMAGARIPEGKGVQKFIVYTKDGANIIIDDQEKTIIITRLTKMMGDIAGAAKGMKKPSAPSAAKDTSSPPQMTKTGNTKLISGYTAEEYKITDNKGHEAHIWYAKVDFNTQLLYSFGLGAVDASAVKGYRVLDYSNMGLKEMMQQGQQKKGS